MYGDLFEDIYIYIYILLHVAKLCLFRRCFVLLLSFVLLRVMFGLCENFRGAGSEEVRARAERDVIERECRLFARGAAALK